MNTKEKAPAGTEAQSNKITVKSTKKRPGKLETILKHLAEGNSLNRFQAERLGDHTLPTTISDLSKKYGLNFSRERVNVPNNFGGQTSVSVYWLEKGENLNRARQVLNIGRG